jgi:phosphoribosylformylglycinamidine synthase PurS subunit
MPKVTVIVTLKPSLLDAQGRVVQDALHSLGYANVEQVRIGKYMELEVTAADGADGETLDRQIKEMCERLLANPVIENYRYEVNS